MQEGAASPAWLDVDEGNVGLEVVGAATLVLGHPVRKKKQLS